MNKEREIIQILVENLKFNDYVKVTNYISDLKIANNESKKKYFNVVADYQIEHYKIIKALELLDESQKGLEEWHYDGYDPCLLDIIRILKGE